MLLLWLIEMWVGFMFNQTSKHIIIFVDPSFQSAASLKEKHGDQFQFIQKRKLAAQIVKQVACRLFSALILRWARAASVRLLPRIQRSSASSALTLPALVELELLLDVEDSEDELLELSPLASCSSLSSLTSFANSSSKAMGMSTGKIGWVLTLHQNDCILKSH